MIIATPKKVDSSVFNWIGGRWRTNGYWMQRVFNSLPLLIWRCWQCSSATLSMLDMKPLHRISQWEWNCNAWEWKPGASSHLFKDVKARMKTKNTPKCWQIAFLQLRCNGRHCRKISPEAKIYKMCSIGLHLPSTLNICFGCEPFSPCVCFV